MSFWHGALFGFPKICWKRLTLSQSGSVCRQFGANSDALLVSPKTNWQIPEETKSWNRHAWALASYMGTMWRTTPSPRVNQDFRAALTPRTYTSTSQSDKPYRARLSKSLGCRVQCASQGAVYQRGLSPWHVISVDHWITQICRHHIQQDPMYMQVDMLSAHTGYLYLMLQAFLVIIVPIVAAFFLSPS